MRFVLLIALVVLGVAWAVEEEAIIRALTSEEEEEQETLLDDMTDVQGRIDLVRVLGDLVDDDAGEEAEADVEDNENDNDSLEGRARPLVLRLPFMRKRKNNRSRYDTSAAEKRLSAQAQHQYNNLVDTLLRHVNANARKLDPMMVSIMPDKKMSGLLKKTRYPKLLNLDEVEDNSDNDDTEQIESEHNIERREIDEKEEEDEDEEELVEEGRRLSTYGEDENTVEAQAKRLKLPKRKKNNNKRSKGKGKGNKRRKQNKKKTKKSPSKNNNKNNKNNRNNSKNKKRSGNRKPKSQSNRGTKNRINHLPSVRTSRAEVTGFATLRRDGDVKITTRSNGITEVKTDLVTGPVNLKVTRRFGTGKKTITRIGNVASPQMKGSMVISIDARGKKQKITKFQILRPSIVTTHGSLAKEPTKRKANNNFLEKTLPRVTPVVTKKLMLVARNTLNAN